MSFENGTSEMEHLRRSWGWLLALGIWMAILGIGALFMIPIATVAAVLVLGWLMLISGVVEGVHAFRVRAWSGAFLHVIFAILGVVIGLLVITHPLAGALAWTLVFASFLTVVGLFRMLAALRMKFSGWRWALFDGVMTFALGVLLWMEWPFSGLWFFGLALGISLLLRGWSYATMALALRAIPLSGELPGSSVPRAA